MFATLIACHGSPPAEDTAPAPGASRPQVVTSLADAEGPTLLGNPLQFFAHGIAFAGDLTGDGRSSLAVMADKGPLCLYGPDLGPATPADAALACYTADSPQDLAGTALAAGGDATGDGQPDVLVGATAASDAGPNAGAIYLLAAPFFGGALAGGYAVFTGEAAGDQAGTAASFAGDVDGDGFEDVLLGAWQNDAGGAGGGKAYLFRGPVEAGVQSLAAADAAIVGSGLVSTPPPDGFDAPLHGAPPEGDGVGSVVRGVGDTNGDGLADLGLGVNGSDRAGTDAGLVSLFYGPVADGAQDLSDADREYTGGTTLEYAGDNLIGAGDLDGDGRAEVLAAGDMAANGRVWLIEGEAPSQPLASFATTFEGQSPLDVAGSTMAPAGDLDGDGHPDLAFGAYQADGGAPDSGIIYIVFGPVAPGTHPLGDAPLLLLGEGPNDWAGIGLAGGGDIDGDGLPELLVGAQHNDEGGPYAGKAYVLMLP